MGSILYIPNTTIPDWALDLTPDCPLVIDDLPPQDYHNTPALMSNSALKELAPPNTPAHYAYWLKQPPKPRPKFKHDDPLVIGDAFHALVLEPEHFKERYIEVPDFGNMQSSKNRALRDTWLEIDAGGMQPLQPGVIVMVNLMRDSLLSNRRIRRAIENGQSEVTIVWVDSDTGIPCKCRIDFISEIEGLAVDLKSALCANPDIWKRAAGDLRYHVQDAFYRYGLREVGLEVKDFMFAVAEKKGPWLVAPITLKERSRITGELIFQRDLATLRTCIENNHFPGYGEEVIEVELMPWHLHELDDHNQR